MENAFNMHNTYGNNISDDLFSCLEYLSEGTTGVIRSDNKKKIKEIVKYPVISDDSLKSKLTVAIYYIKICKIIEGLLAEYSEYDDEFKKDIIDYYIKSNGIKELNSIGLGWYYDMKYKQNSTTLYSVEYGMPCNWDEWLTLNYKSENKMKERGMQLIFQACKEHINRGGKVRLKSLSKCFGVDLFKYMKLDEKGFANLYIIKDAPINFIEYNGEKMALQRYMPSSRYNSFNIDDNPGFCLDFSHPRNEKPKNYNKWSKNFLNDDQFISQREWECYKNCDMSDSVISQFLTNKHTEGGNRALSSRVSPIADKEVIANKEFWEIQDYSEQSEAKDFMNKCCHVKFNESEYAQLIFYYFKKCYENQEKSSQQTSFTKLYNSCLKNEKYVAENIIRDLEDKNQHLSIEDKEYQKNKGVIDFCNSFINVCNTVKSDTNESEKIKFTLSFISDWNTDRVPKNWSYNNIYKLEE